MAVTFTYNGSDTVSATFLSTLGVNYRMFSGDGFSTNDDETGTGGVITMQITDISGVTPGDTFAVFIEAFQGSFSQGDFVGATIYAFGTSSEYSHDATWNFDGVDTVSVTGSWPTGANMKLEAADPNPSGTGQVPATFFTATGASETQSVTFGANPTSPSFYAFMQDIDALSGDGNLSNRLFAATVSGDGDPGNPSTAPPPPPSQVRFFEGYPWRLLITDLDSVSQTLLSRLSNPMTFTKTRNAPMQIGAGDPSDNPQVNILGNDGDPFLAEGTRLVFIFRREGGTPTNVPTTCSFGTPDTAEGPWIVRAAGIILGMNDNADPSEATSTLTAYDPWKYLYSRPVLTVDGFGNYVFPNAGGLQYGTGTVAGGIPGDQIIIDQLTKSEAFYGTTRLDWGQIFGGAFYTGTIEGTDVIEQMIFQRGASVGEVLDQVIATGTCNVVIEPIYDPCNRPGIIGELSIYNPENTGTQQNGAIFGWDDWPKNVVNISRNTDGTARANFIQYYAGQGGIPAIPASSASSIAKYGEYVQVQYYPGKTALADVDLAAIQQLDQVSNGQETFSLDPSTDRAPIPLVEYDIHDTVPVYASKRLRQQIATDVRVESLTLTVDSDSFERASLTISTQTSIPDSTPGPDTTPPAFLDATVDGDDLVLFYSETLA